MNDLWSAFPTFMRFYDTLTAKQQQALRLYIQAAARKPEATPKTPYGSDDSQSSVMILHYVETLFMNFDKDHDSFIDQDEASKAFPTFARVLGEMAKMEPSKPTLKSVFFWVLTHGAPPVDDNMGWWRGFWSSLGFLDYDARVRETVWGWGRPVKFKASRLDLFKVFATLSAPPKTE